MIFFDDDALIENISNGNIKKVIEDLKITVPKGYKVYKNIVILSAEYTRLCDEKNKHTIDDKNFSLGINSITKSLLDIIDQIKILEKEEAEKKTGFLKNEARDVNNNYPKKGYGRIWNLILNPVIYLALSLLMLIYIVILVPWMGLHKQAKLFHYKPIIENDGIYFKFIRVNFDNDQGSSIFYFSLIDTSNFSLAMYPGPMTNAYPDYLPYPEYSSRMSVSNSNFEFKREFYNLGDNRLLKWKINIKNKNKLNLYSKNFFFHFKQKNNPSQIFPSKELKLIDFLCIFPLLYCVIPIICSLICYSLKISVYD